MTHHESNLYSIVAHGSVLVHVTVIKPSDAPQVVGSVPVPVRVTSLDVASTSIHVLDVHVPLLVHVTVYVPLPLTVIDAEAIPLLRSYASAPLAVSVISSVLHVRSDDLVMVTGVIDPSLIVIISLPEHVSGLLSVTVTVYVCHHVSQSKTTVVAPVLFIVFITLPLLNVYV